MGRYGRRPRSYIGIEKAADRQGWRSRSVTRTTSHTHNTLSWIFNETDDSSSCICHQIGSRNSTPDILSVFSVRLTTILRVSVSRVVCEPTPSQWPHSFLSHTHRFLGSRNSTTDNLSTCSSRLLCIFVQTFRGTRFSDRLHCKLVYCYFCRITWIPVETDCTLLLIQEFIFHKQTTTCFRHVSFKVWYQTFFGVVYIKIFWGVRYLIINQVFCIISFTKLLLTNQKRQTNTTE